MFKDERVNSAEQNVLIPIAQEVLGKLDEVAKAARAWLNNLGSLSAHSLVPNSVSVEAIRNIGQVNQQNQAAYLRLSKEPIVSRVVVKDEKNKLQTYFFFFFY